MTALNEKAMLVSLKISAWTARKHDKRISQEVADNHGASLDAGRYNKTLIASASLEKIVSAASEARNWLYANSLPWLQNGAQILPAANYFNVSQKMAELRRVHEAEVENFLAAYPYLVEDSRARLGAMFNPADYPSEREIRRRFGFEVTFLPFPTTADWRLDVTEAERTRLAADAEATVNAAVKDAMDDLWERLHSVVEKMAGSLKGFQPATDTAKASGIFRDSLVGNVRELVELLPRLNLTGDPELTRLTLEAESRLCQHDAQELRDDETLRASVAAEADAILSQMAGFAAPMHAIAA